MSQTLNLTEHIDYTMTHMAFSLTLPTDVRHNSPTAHPPEAESLEAASFLSPGVLDDCPINSTFACKLRIKDTLVTYDAI